MIKLKDFTSEESEVFGNSDENEIFNLIGVNNDIGLHPSTRNASVNKTKYKKVNLGNISSLYIE